MSLCLIDSNFDMISKFVKVFPFLDLLCDFAPSKV